jgi:hypothetical protein
VVHNLDGLAPHLARWIIGDVAAGLFQHESSGASGSVECIGKGTAIALSGFDCRVSIATPITRPTLVANPPKL